MPKEIQGELLDKSDKHFVIAITIYLSPTQIRDSDLHPIYVGAGKIEGFHLEINGKHFILKVGEQFQDDVSIKVPPLGFSAEKGIDLSETQFTICFEGDLWFSDEWKNYLQTL